MTAMFAGSLRHKLLGVMLLTTLVALVFALGAMIMYDLRAYHQGWVNDMNSQAELLGRTTAPALTFDDAATARENLGSLRFRPKVRAAALYTARGAVFATYVAQGERAVFPEQPEEEGVRIDDRSLVVFKRIVDNGEVVGTVYLRAEYEFYERLKGYIGIALLVMMAAMLVALLVSSWLQKIVTRPILAIATIAREVVAQDDYSRRAERISDDEVGALAESFNNMLSEIERRTQALEASGQEKAREVDERRLAQQEIMRLNEELEVRVRDRTLQLENSNRELGVATEAAQSANRAKSEFLSSMSHELRTPLNAILGFGQLLASNTMRSTPEQQKAFIDHIVTAGKHLLTLIDEILNLAQIESGKLTLSLERVALADMLAECNTMVEPLANQRNVRLLFPAECDVGVMADRTRLKQVLLNLLSNAIKYNRELGAVVVDCLQTAEGRVRVSVQDTGMGLSSEQVQSLFQPFNRLGQEGGTLEGTGIGLVVTKRLIELMGGVIGVASTPGMGSVFWIELKVAATLSAVRGGGEAVAAARQSAPHDGRPVRTVLYVEDNPASLKLVEQVLGFRGDLLLISAPNGRVGVDMALSNRPDVILMDINLPGFDGHAAREILRQDARTAHIPVIAITASAMPKAIGQGLAGGFFRYITKPINIDDLLSAIDLALAARDEVDTSQQAS